MNYPRKKLRYIRPECLAVELNLYNSLLYGIEYLVTFSSLRIQQEDDVANGKRGLFFDEEDEDNDELDYQLPHFKSLWDD